MVGTNEDQVVLLAGIGGQGIQVAGKTLAPADLEAVTRRSKEAVQKALDAGGNDFMIKPFQPRAVLERLARWLPEE